ACFQYATFLSSFVETFQRFVEERFNISSFQRSNADLPDVTNDLAAEVLAEGFSPRHQALRGRQNRDTQAAEHHRNIVALAVHAQAGLAHTPQPREHRLLVHAVLEPYAEHPVTHLHRHVKVLDIALLLEDAGQVHLYFGGGYQHALVPRHAAIA